MTVPSSDIRKGINILDPHQLYAFAKDKTPEGRRHLATAVSQFFEEKELNELEQSLASEIMLNLIRQAEIDLREALAEKLSVLDNVPSELVVYLANDEIDVARHVLLHSPILNDVDLIYILTAQSEDHWEYIAKRERISPVVTDRLIDSGSPKTILALIDNQRVNLQKSSMRKLVKIAVKSEELQAPLLRRPEIDSDMAIGLYMVVSQNLRKEIVEKFDIAARDIETALDSLVGELANEARGSRDVTDEMRSLAQKMHERNDITPDLLIRTLRRGQFGFFISLMSELTGLSPRKVAVLQSEDGGKAFVVACRHIGMMKSEFASIYLLSRGMRDGDRIVDQRDLAMALRGFDTLKDADVEKIIKSWRAEEAVRA